MDDGRTALCLAQHEHLHRSFFARVGLLFRLDLLIDPVTDPPRLGFVRFAHGALVWSLLGRGRKGAGQRVYRVLRATGQIQHGAEWGEWVDRSTE